MLKQKNFIISSIITVILAFVYFYFMLPPLNITSFVFWVYIFIVAVTYSIVSLLTSIDKKGRLVDLPKLPYYILGGVCGIFVIIFLMDLALSPIFNAKSYAKRIAVNENGKFTEDVKEVDFSSIPLLDKSSSQKLGDRVMGQMPELVSQFEVSNLYTQINYNDQIVRVTPLEYASFIKYFTNKTGGVKGYITVDSVTGESSLTKLDKGMKYVPSALFSEDLDRTLRFKYPTDIFGEESFEIDNDGNPYWVVPVIKYKGVGLQKNITEVVILDPITGDSKKYKINEVPTWVDHVYSADLIIEQYNDWGLYKGGFINSIFGQKNVVQTTEGYNYIAMDDDVYLYTGVTSRASDEANLGFILCNMRTKETVFYSVPGAEEYSAMASAEGQVQQMNYTATFPLLINLNNVPTYLISLKDNAGLVKMYAFVDIANYQKVVVADAALGIEEAAKKYVGTDINYNDEETLKKTIVVNDVVTAIIDGNTYFYITDIEGKKYKVSIKINEDVLPFIRKGDSVNIEYINEEEVIKIVKIS